MILRKIVSIPNNNDNHHVQPKFRMTQYLDIDYGDPIVCLVANQLYGTIQNIELAKVLLHSHFFTGAFENTFY